LPAELNDFLVGEFDYFELALFLRLIWIYVGLALPYLILLLVLPLFKLFRGN